MTLRPFPFPLRIGIDICRIGRVHELNKSARWGAFLKKTLTPRELKYCYELFDLFSRGSNTLERKTVEYISGRWAAKEAVIKAVKDRKLTFKDIEIWPDKNKELIAIILDENISQSESTIEDASTDNEDKAHLNSQEPKDTIMPILEDKTEAKIPSMQAISGYTARVSISHDGDYAVATALVASNGSDT